MALLKNVLRAIAVFLVVTFLAFLLMYGNATGIAHSVLGLNTTDEAVQAKIVELGLDQPLVVQYWTWLRHAVTGDLGRSFYTGQSVSDALSTRVPLSLSRRSMTPLTGLVTQTSTDAVQRGWHAEMSASIMAA